MMLGLVVFFYEAGFLAVGLGIVLVKIPRKPRHFSNGIQAEGHLDSLSIK